MLYLIDPQPYGSGLLDNVKCEFCDPWFLFGRSDRGDAREIPPPAGENAGVRDDSFKKGTDSSKKGIKSPTLEGIFSSVTEFCAGNPLSDDCTVVELCYTSVEE